MTVTNEITLPCLTKYFLAPRPFDHLRCAEDLLHSTKLLAPDARHVRQCYSPVSRLWIREPNLVASGPRGGNGEPTASANMAVFEMGCPRRSLLVPAREELDPLAIVPSHQALYGQMQCRRLLVELPLTNEELLCIPPIGVS